MRAGVAGSQAQADAVRVQATAYDACMDVVGSDHKPVTLAPALLSSVSCCWTATQASLLYKSRSMSHSCRRPLAMPTRAHTDSFMVRLQVWALLAVDIPVTQQERRRTICSELLRQCFAAHAPARPRLELCTDCINLHQVP